MHLKTLKRHAFLYSVIALEGYIVLATELLAIRTTIPYVGSGSDTMAIMIAAILLPLAAGYHFGGKVRSPAIRKKLSLNILIAAFILMIGFSYDLMKFFFESLSAFGIQSRISQSSAFALCFLATPTYLLGQTAPLMSNYFGKERLSAATGKILFFSTLGSFLGATLSTIVFMPTIGVNNTISLNFIIATLLIFMLSKRKNDKLVLASIAISVCALILNSPSVMKRHHIVRANQYTTIQVHEDRAGSRLLRLNNNNSTMIHADGTTPSFISLAEKLTLGENINTDAPAKEVLVLGAGGFTFGYHDTYNRYTYIDIDPDLKNVAERKFLKEPLLDNKSFIAEPARAFLMRENKLYDVIFSDLHLGAVSIPEHLVTYEFFTQVKDHLKSNGIVIFNMVLSPNFKNAASRNIDTTLHAVFPYLSRHVLGDTYDLYSEDENLMRNVFYIYNNDPEYEELKIYTDQKNTLLQDKPANKPKF